MVFSGKIANYKSSWPFAKFACSLTLQQPFLISRFFLVPMVTLLVTVGGIPTHLQQLSLFIFDDAPELGCAASFFYILIRFSEASGRRVGRSSRGYQMTPGDDQVLGDDTEPYLLTTLAPRG